jgi:hypothetical protein
MFKILEVLVGLFNSLIYFHYLGVNSIEGFLDFQPVIVVFDSRCLYILCGVLFDVFEFHFDFSLHLFTIDKSPLLKGLLEFLDLSINSLPVFFESIVEDLIDDGDKMGIMFRLLDTTGHAFGIIVHFVDELVVLVKFLVKNLDNFLFLL